MEKILDESSQKRFRSQGIITEDEVVAQVGDKFVAVNVLTQSRRMVTISSSTISETIQDKRLLKD